MKRHARIARIFTAATLFAFAVPIFPQSTNNTSTNRTARGPQGPRVISPEVSTDRKITFRILAPKAESVKLGAGDIQGLSTDATVMTKAPTAFGNSQSVLSPPAHTVTISTWRV